MFGSLFSPIPCARNSFCPFLPGRTELIMIPLEYCPSPLCGAFREALGHGGSLPISCHQLSQPTFLLMPGSLHHHCEGSNLSPRSGYELFQDKDTDSFFPSLSSLPEGQEHSRGSDNMVLMKTGDVTSLRSSQIIHIIKSKYEFQMGCEHIGLMLP